MMAGRLRQLRGIVLWVLWWATAIGAGAAETVTTNGKIVWALLDFPPFQILGGDFRGSGSFDGLRELLVSQMPEYQHEVIGMTFARREEELRQGQALCTPGMFRTPARESLLVFSRPALVHLDNRLVFRAALAERFGRQTEADLATLLAQPDLVGGVISERSFAPNIDELLRRHRGQANLVSRSIRSTQILEMLVGGEIDYTILFPHEVAYLAGQLRIKEPLVVRPIAGVPPYIFTHVACTKGPWGEAVIQRVNEIIGRSRASSRYRAFSERWYQEPDQALIRKYYSQLLAAPD